MIYGTYRILPLEGGSALPFVNCFCGLVFVHAENSAQGMDKGRTVTLAWYLGYVIVLQFLLQAFLFQVIYIWILWKGNKCSLHNGAEQ